MVVCRVIWCGIVCRDTRSRRRDPHFEVQDPRSSAVFDGRMCSFPRDECRCYYFLSLARERQQEAMDQWSRYREGPFVQFVIWQAAVEGRSDGSSILEGSCCPARQDSHRRTGRRPCSYLTNVLMCGDGKRRGQGGGVAGLFCS